VVVVPFEIILELKKNLPHISVAQEIIGLAQVHANSNWDPVNVVFN